MRRFMMVVLILGLSGCLRYYPSRQELMESAPEGEVKNVVLGPTAFHAIERSQVKRLNALVKQRSAIARARVGSTYHIGIEDLLQLEVFDVPELNRKVRVQPTGMISLPLAGAMHVDGLSEEQVQQLIAKRLDGFLHSPQVSVFIAEYGSQKVSVIGEVAKPGSYSLKREDQLLLDLLSEAGGRTEKAAGEVILIPASAPELEESSGASSEGKPVSPKSFGIRIPFDYLVGSGDRLPIGVPLIAGDTIVVPESGMVQVDGEVKKPGSIQLASRMTLLGAIAAAGSVNYSADVHSVEVIREMVPGKKAILSVDLDQLALGNQKDVRLRDGDVVRVPSHGRRFFTRQIIDSISGFLNIGVGGNVNLGQ